MKILKSVLFGTVFMVGIAATPNANLDNCEVEEAYVPCSSVYTVCDNAHPDSFEDFDSCMSSNGC